MASARVFVARLTGLAVFGPDGERIGKVRDVVVSLRVDSHPPRVLGLVVDLSARRSIFVPMLRVSDIAGSAVTLASGSVNLRAFDQRANETLVLGELLNSPVVVRDSGDDGVVVDVAIEPTRTRDWAITRVAVRFRRTRLARRARVDVHGWENVSGLDVAAAQGADRLLAVFDSMRPADVAAALSRLPDERQHQVVDALDDERLADVFEELSESDQRELLAYLDDDRAADVLEAMSPDDAADLLGELPDDEAGRLLGLMEPGESEPVRRLMRYEWDTAGGLMTPEPITLGPDATVAEALARIRHPEIPPALASMVFVVRPPTATPTGRYLGCVHTQQLLRAAPFELVAGMVDTELSQIGPETGLGEVTRWFATYNLVAGPVVDAQNHLLGAVTVDDVLDHLLPQGWRDRDLGPAEVGRGSVNGRPEARHA
ncbi:MULTISPECIES: magnesium transporter MgtE N-terminal domain-containing protein [Pseudonocardia]|uniref:Magnesium transporter MgtE n=2 Tax=Pseudonocardia TaxID=1847 RepID=A0A1Y2N4P6_PSEAH|nr:MULTISPECIES: CBS domain-containing protein [Pseudonocardia]OSY42454.1 Magnesium transporter MgtE [Pseudonocardia autotrophica]TDN75974.1 Mg/Co/Ni transporter MgtE [Pseudonocardia autotrophica]BBF99946.1 magnesium transporter [Pseudonocardia autotrophica]GEC25006.1 magnesium transporter [Pseudonocardia saturnea]